MVDRDVRRTRRIVRHANRPRPVGAAPGSAATDPDPAGSEAPETGGPDANLTDSDVTLRESAVAGTEAGTEPDETADPADSADSAASADPIGPEAKPSLGSMRVAERPEGFPTVETLADQDAEAAALRQQLDQLRKLLDDGPPPLPPARKRNRRPLLGVLVVGGTLGLLATATLVPWSKLDLPGQVHSTSTAAPVGAPAAINPAAGTAPRPGTNSSLAPRVAPAGALPATGPGIDAPGSMMVVQVGSDGAVTVMEQAVLGPRGMREIPLALPSMASLTGDISDLRPSVSDLRVAVNGTPVHVSANDDVSSWTVAPLSGRARTVQLSYRLVGAMLRSKPSDSGRALALSLPLLGQTLREQGYPLVVRAAGRPGQISLLTCPGTPSAQTLCGTQIRGGWSATVPTSATSPAVLLQLNLNA